MSGILYILLKIINISLPRPVVCNSQNRGQSKKSQGRTALKNRGGSLVVGSIPSKEAVPPPLPDPQTHRPTHILYSKTCKMSSPWTVSGWWGRCSKGLFLVCLGYFRVDHQLRGGGGGGGLAWVNAVKREHREKIYIFE